VVHAEFRRRREGRQHNPVFPLTHFLRIVRGILLKGNGFEDVILQLWQIGLFAAIALTIGVMRYRQTLD
jgi:ABC-2 type transport system permease protein